MMKISLENVLVDCLNDTLHLMLCSESTSTICTINSLVNRYPMFSFVKACSSKAMRQCFRKLPVWHCLILDSRSSFCGDFFSAVREFPLWIPIILLADSVSEEQMRMYGLSTDKDDSNAVQDLVLDENTPVKGKLFVGIKHIIVSPLRSFKHLFPIIREESVKKKLMQKQMPDEFIQNALDHLYKYSPVIVEEWSSYIGSTPRIFQKMFKNFTYYSPKKLIFLHHAYRIAFETIGRDEDFRKGIISAYIMDERLKKRVLEYVLSRRSQLLSVK